MLAYLDAAIENKCVLQRAARPVTVNVQVGKCTCRCACPICIHSLTSPYTAAVKLGQQHNAILLDKDNKLLLRYQQPK